MKLLYIIFPAFCTFAALQNFASQIIIPFKRNLLHSQHNFSSRTGSRSASPDRISGRTAKSGKHRTDTCCPGNGLFPAGNCI